MGDCLMEADKKRQTAVLDAMLYKRQNTKQKETKKNRIKDLFASKVLL